MQADDILAEVIAMSRTLGDPALDYVILGEGNTSARADEQTLWVKASGVYMLGIKAAAFVRVRLAPMLAMLDGPDLTDEETKDQLSWAKVDPQTQERPSVETALHALALDLPDIYFVGHTHPTAINALSQTERPRLAVVLRVIAVRDDLPRKNRTASAKRLTIDSSVPADRHGVEPKRTLMWVSPLGTGKRSRP